MQPQTWDQAQTWDQPLPGFVWKQRDVIHVQVSNFQDQVSHCLSAVKLRYFPKVYQPPSPGTYVPTENKKHFSHLTVVAVCAPSRWVLGFGKRACKLILAFGSSSAGAGLLSVHRVNTVHRVFTLNVVPHCTLTFKTK